MKKKQQPQEHNTTTSNRLVNRLYKSRPKAPRPETEALNSTQFLVPKVTFKHKLQPIEPILLPFQSRIASFLDKKKTQAPITSGRALQKQRSSSRVKSKIYSSLDNSVDYMASSTPALKEPEKPKAPQTSYLTPEDFMQIIKLDRQMSEEFCYLRRKQGPYSWQIVDFESRDPKQYMVISKRGLTRYVNNIGEFITFEAFMEQAKIYNRLMEIEYFKTYKRWKNFSIWKKLTKMSRLLQTMKNLDNIILISDDYIKEGIHNLHMKCKQLQVMELFYNKILNVMTLTDFLGYSKTERNKALEKMAEFDKFIVETIQTTCNKSMDLFMKRMRINKDKTMNDKKVPLVIGDELGKDMPYTEEATIKTHQLKLRNFIKMADYLILTSKIQLFKNSAIEMNKVISDTNTAFVQNIKKGYGKSAWIRIEVQQHDQALYFVPPVSQVNEVLQEVLFETVLQLCKTHTQFLHLPQFQVYSKQRDSQPSDEKIELQNVVNADSAFSNLINVYKSHISTSLVYVEEHAKVLDQSLEFLKRVRSLKGMALEQCSSEFFRDKLLDIKTQSAALKAIQTQADIGLYIFDCAKYKQTVDDSVNSVLQLLGNVIPELLHTRSRKYLKAINTNYNLVAQTPSNLQSYFEFLEHLKQVNIATEELSPDINDTLYMLVVAEQFGIKVSEVGKNQVSEVNGQIIGLKRRLEEINSGGQLLLDKFKKEIEKLIPTFDDRIKVHQEKVSALAPLKNSSSAGEKVKQLAALNKILETINKDRNDLNRYQQILALQQTTFEHLDKYTVVFRYTQSMWKAKHEWQMLMRTISKTHIKQAKLTVLKLKIEETENVIKDCQRELDPNQVILDLKQQVTNFKPLFSVLVQLNNQDLLENHWQEIRQLVEEDVKEQSIKIAPEVLTNLFKDINSQQLTIEFLKQIKLAIHGPGIQQISIKATKESELSKLVVQLQSFWRSNSIQIAWHRDVKEVSVLANNDELIGKIEDNLIIANKVLGSKYVGFIKPRAELQYKMLSYVHQLMDEWYHHQHNWIYLEPILKSQFAVKNLPKECATFAQADGVWRRIMKLVRDNSSTKRYGDEYQSKFTLVQLRNNNATFDSLQKALEEFMQRKREIFGRFFLLSNQELLQILANVKQTSHLSKYLFKVFESVSEIIIDDKSNVVGIKGFQGETILLKSCLLKGEPQEWFKAIEDSIRLSIKIIIRHQLASYNSEDMDRVTWIKSNLPCQILLTVDSISWTTNTELYLQGKDDLFIYDWLEVQNIQLQEGIALLRQSSPGLYRLSLTNLILQNIHQRDIIETLLPCESKEDFRWFQRIRFYYEEDLINIKVMDTYSPYGYEYVGVNESFVMMATTDRCWLSILNSLNRRRVAFLTGHTATGKTQTYRQLSKILAKNSMVFECTPEVSAQIITKIITGISYVGAWICFEEAHRLKPEVMSVLAQHLWRIRDAIANGFKQATISEKRLAINPDMGIVMTSTLPPVGFPPNLLAQMRPIYMWVPDKQKILETLLFTQGVQPHKEITAKIIKFLQLCKDQLSDHLNYSIRQTLAIGHAVISEWRSAKHPHEDHQLPKVFKTLIEPILSAKDTVLFNWMISQMFNAKIQHLEAISEASFEARKILKDKIKQFGLTQTQGMIEKIEQVSEILKVRYSVIMIGQTMTGKSTILKLALQHGIQQTTPPTQIMPPVYVYPGSFTANDLFGVFDQTSGNWRDGLVPKCLKNISKQAQNVYIFDGQLDTPWAQYICPMLDPTHCLTLANTERLYFTEKTFRVLFECEDLKNASPALLTRCAIAKTSQNTIGHEPIIDSFFSSVNEKYLSHLTGVVKTSYRKGVAYTKRNCKEMILGSSTLLSYCKLVKFMFEDQQVQGHLARDSWKKLVEKICIFAFTWSVGGLVAHQSYNKFDKCLSECFSPQQLKAPMFNYIINFSKPEGEWVLWSSFADNYQPEGRKFIPTKETSIMQHLTHLLSNHLSPLLIMSPAGNGKTTAINAALSSEQLASSSLCLPITLSGFRASEDIQYLIEAKMQSQRKLGVISLLPPPGQKLICLVDDINLIHSECYTSMELLRSLLANSVLWDRKSWTPKNVIDYQIILTISSESQINSISSRLQRHFNMIYVPSMEDQSMLGITHTFCKSLPGVNPQVTMFLQSKSLGIATVQFFAHLKSLATPTTPHLIFNFHHIMQVFAGIQKAFNPNKDLTVNKQDTLIKLWIHEIRSVVMNRLDNTELQHALSEEIKKKVIITLKYNLDADELLYQQTIIFSPLNINHYYSYVSDPEDLANQIKQHCGGDLCLSKTLLVRLCSVVRALNQGDLMVVGLDGQGKKTLLKCAGIMLGYSLLEMKDQKVITCMKKLCEEKKPTLLIAREPSVDKLQELMLLPQLNSADQQELSKTTNPKVFADIVSQHLHLAITFNPQRPAFRRSMRQLPAVTTQFQIDYWMPYTESALVEIAAKVIPEGKFNDLAAKMYMQIKLTSAGEYFDLLTIYDLTMKRQQAKSEKRVTSLTKAIAKFDASVNRLKEIASKMEQNLPLKDKLAHQAEECFQKLQKVQQNATNFKGLLEADEKVLEQESQKVKQQQAQLDKLTSEVMAPLTNVLELIASLTRNDISEMKQLYSGQNVPADLRTALDCVAIILQEKEDTDTIKKLINEGGFLNRFKNLDTLATARKVHNSLKSKLSQNPNFKPSDMKGANLAAKLFCELSWHINHLPQSHKPVDQKKATFQQSTNALAKVENVTKVKRDRMDQFNAQIKDLEKKYRELIDTKQATENDITKAQIQLAAGEKLMRQSNSICQRWKQELDKVKKASETLDQVTFMACCSLVLTSKFQHHKCIEAREKWQPLLASMPSQQNWVNFFSQSKLQNTLLSNSLPLDNHLLEKLCYIERSTHPLIILDKFCIAIPVLQLLEPAIFIDSNELNEKLADLFKQQKTTCFIKVSKFSILTDLQFLFEWDFSKIRRPQEIGGHKVLASPSFRWHFVICDSSVQAESSALRTVDFTPMIQTLGSIVTTRLSANEDLIKLRSEKNIARLKTLKDSSYLLQNQQFITDAFQSTASQLFDNQSLVEKICTASTNVASALRNLSQIKISEQIENNKVAQRILDVYSIIQKVRTLSKLYSNLSFERFLEICQQVIKIEQTEADAQQKIYSLCDYLANYVFAFDHRLLFMFLVSCQVAVIKNLIKQSEYDLFRQGIPDVKQLLKKMTNQKIVTLVKDQRQCLQFCSNPYEYEQFQQLELTDFEQILIFSVHSKNLPEEIVQRFIQKSLGKPYQPGKPALKDLFLNSGKVMEFVQDVLPYNVSDVVATFAKIVGAPKLKMYSLGDPDIHARVERTLTRALAEGNWVILANSHFQTPFSLKKVAQINSLQKIHPSFRLFFIHEPSFPLIKNYTLKSTYHQDVMTMFAKMSHTQVIQALHTFLNANFNGRFSFKYLLVCFEFFEPLVKGKPLQSLWDEIRFAAECSYGCLLNGPSDFTDLVLVIEKFRYKQEVGRQKKILTNAVQMAIEMQKIYQLTDYQKSLRIVEGLIGRLPLPIKKKAAAAEKAPVIHSTGPDFLESFFADQMEGYNVLIKELDSSLHRLRKALLGQATFEVYMKILIQSININEVPKDWINIFMSNSTKLTIAYDQFIKRVEYIRSYVNEKVKAYCLSAFISPKMLLNSILFAQAKKRKKPFSILSFEHSFKSDKEALDQTEGCYIEQTNCNGFIIDLKNQIIRESESEQTKTPCPLIYFKVVENAQFNEALIDIPLICNPGGINTSTLVVRCESNESKDFWKLRKSCFISELG